MVDLEEAINNVKSMVENRTEDTAVMLPSSVLELAGMRKLTSLHRRENSGTMYGDYTPNALKDPDAPRLSQNGVGRSHERFASHPSIGPGAIP